MISNEALAEVNTREKLEKLFEAFGKKTAHDKVEFLDLITTFRTGFSGVRSHDLEAAAKHFLKHEWQTIIR